MRGEPDPLLLWPDFYDWQRWVVNADEDALETRHWHSSAVFALRWIDANERAPDYEDLRAGFAQRYAELSAPSRESMGALVKRMNLAGEYAANVERYWTNFTNGLASPDPEQRKRFEELNGLIRTWTLPEAMPILACLEQAILPKGRRGNKAIPSAKDRQVLARMKPMILHEGLSKTAAARIVANEIAKPHMVETTIKRLVRGWNWKMSRRQFQEEK